MPSKKKKLGFRIRDDEDVVKDWLQPFQDMDQFSNLMRLLIYERMGESIPDDLELLARAVGAPQVHQEINALWEAVDDIRTELLEIRQMGTDPAVMREVMQRLSDLETAVNELRGRQAVYADEHEDGTPKPQLVGKQAELSAKLKGMKNQFSVLKH